MSFCTIYLQLYLRIIYSRRRSSRLALAKDPSTSKNEPLMQSTNRLKSIRKAASLNALRLEGSEAAEDFIQRWDAYNKQLSGVEDTVNTLQMAARNYLRYASTKGVFDGDVAMH